MAYNPPIGSIYHLYTTYILPSGGLYATYHLLGEPETTIDNIYLLSVLYPISYPTFHFVEIIFTCVGDVRTVWSMDHKKDLGMGVSAAYAIPLEHHFVTWLATRS